jgi:hypothetical protein
MNRVAVALLVLALAACAAGSHALVPSTVAPAATGSSAGPNDATPGNGAGALPGNGAGALPGATLPCTLSLNAGQASCTVAINVNVPPIPDPNTPGAMLPGLHPAELRSAYALPFNGSGGTVAIVDAFDDPAAESDLAVYRNAYGMPPCGIANGCLRKVNQRGSTASYPAANVAWSQEIALDLEMVSAACPNCRLLLVEADSASIDDLGAGADAAVALGAHVVSNSFYAVEWAGETAEDVHYRHPGVTMTVSSGDRVAPFYPAASPYVLAVGGTSLSSGGSGGWTQAPWAYDGRGCSAYEPRPRYQTNSGCKSRSTVDVSAVADPQTGVSAFVTQAGGWVVAGGTSVGAPIVAAACALAGNTPAPGYPYAHPSGFRDIAPRGYDEATGLGTPIGVSGL